MRITTGIYKGRLINMPKGIRPTQDKARKAIFDILGDIEGLTFLELFAGSGAVGIEALSRGAKEAVFVENKRECLRQIEANLALLGLALGVVIGLDAQEAIKKLSQKGRKFEIIFLDPPYYADAATPNPIGWVGVPLSVAKKTLHTLTSYDILAPDGLVVVQHYKKDALPDTPGDLILFKQSRYGDTALSFYRKNHVPDSHISRDV